MTFSRCTGFDGPVTRHEHLKAKGRKEVALASVKLALKFNPAMKKTLVKL